MNADDYEFSVQLFTLHAMFTVTGNRENKAELLAQMEALIEGKINQMEDDAEREAA